MRWITRECPILLWVALFLFCTLLAACCSGAPPQPIPTAPPVAPVAHGAIIPYVSATIQTVSYLGWWAQHNPRA